MHLSELSRQKKIDIIRHMDATYCDYTDVETYADEELDEAFMELGERHTRDNQEEGDWGPFRTEYDYSEDEGPDEWYDRAAQERCWL